MSASRLAPWILLVWLAPAYPQAPVMRHPADRNAFRLWFTYLAESQAVIEQSRLPGEIHDCSSLVRFAYRESLRKHDSAWLRSLYLPGIPAFPRIENYTVDLPRIFQMSRTEYGQFADAKSLRAWNCYRAGETLEAARPGDLLFYEQATGNLRHHVMVFAGRGHFDKSETWVVYHTGPSAEGPGAMRRVTAGELIRHPEFRWRPLRSNPSFLGVYRWNILREGD